MELKEILYGLEKIKAKGELNLDIPNVVSNSKEVKPGDMFVVINGFEANGEEYIGEAIKNGAKVIMAQYDIDKNIILSKPNEVTIILVENVRHALAIVACNFYKNPSRKFKLIGVTGTKGKTTTTYMIKDMLEKQGIKVGLIGTICTYINGESLGDNDRTTPESLELQKLFRMMADEGCQVVVMEVSSQSLKLSRVDGCEFDIGIFTNFSEDHISEKEHPDMEDYFNSKVKLLKMCKYCYVNIDNIYTAKLPNLLPDSSIKTYGVDNPANLIAKDITVTNTTADFKVKINDRNERVKVGIPGRFSVYNALAAICVGTQLGCSTENIKEALLNVRVPGRSELIDNKKELKVMIDYAHSPESLENILQSAKEYTIGNVICVFGCGGDRDALKRPIMGEIAGKLANYTIITSDNPRTEDPESIVNQIEEGIKKTKGKYECIVDRREAIEKAIKMERKNDIVIIAGKGHELTQEINHKKYPFCEKEIVQEIIENL